MSKKFNHISSNIHRLVYKWFYFIYKLSYGLGIVGYIIMMLTFVGFNLVFNQPPTVWMDIGLMFLYYGVYYGVLGRDIAEICADKMAANIGVRLFLIALLFTPKYLTIFLISAVLHSTRNANTKPGPKRMRCMWQRFIS